MRRAMKRAVRRPGRTLLSDLETRLDDVVLRAGFAPTIYQARQAISHGHIQVDAPGRQADLPATARSGHRGREAQQGQDAFLDRRDWRVASHPAPDLRR
jgi:small subunit ribosomal protein S4